MGLSSEHDKPAVTTKRISSPNRFRNLKWFLHLPAFVKLDRTLISFYLKRKHYILRNLKNSLMSRQSNTSMHVWRKSISYMVCVSLHHLTPSIYFNSWEYCPSTVKRMIICPIFLSLMYYLQKHILSGL